MGKVNIKSVENGEVLFKQTPKTNYKWIYLHTRLHQDRWVLFMNYTTKQRVDDNVLCKPIL